MERSLTEDFRLDSDYAIFARCARGQEMPATDGSHPGPGHCGFYEMTAAGLATAGGAVILSWLIVNQRANPGGARPDVST